MATTRNSKGATSTALIAAASLIGGVVGAVALPGVAQATPPTFTKVFVPDEIGPGSVSTLTFTIDNTAEVVLADELAFSDPLPAGVVIATPANASTTCDPDAGGDGPSVSAPAGGGTISLNDAGVGAGATCSVSVDVTSSTAGTHTNTSGALTSSLGNSGTASDDLIVATDRPGFLKDFAPDPIDKGERSTLTFTIDNTSNAAAVTLASFTDTLPAGLVIADPANVSTTCVNTIGDGLTAVPGSDTISYEAIAISVVGASSTCFIEVDVAADGSGTLINSTSNLQTTVAATARSAGKATASLVVTRADLHLTKEFNDDPVPPGGTATVEFTIENFDRNFPATGVAFTDTLPGGVVVATPNGETNTCGGTLTATSGTGAISLAGGTVAAEGFCTITVSVTAAAAGTYTNETGAVSGTVDGDAVVGNTGKDDLFVVPAPILTKEFTDDPVGPGDVATIHFELTDTTTAGGSTDIAFTDKLTAVLSGLNVPSSTVTIGASSFGAVFQRWSTLEPVGLMGTVQYGDGVGGNLGGCTPFGPGSLAGLVVIVDDVGCTTTAKIQNIDAGGAVAGLVSTLDGFDLPINTPFAGGPRPSIPGYEVAKTTADTIKALAGSTATIDTLDVAVPLPDFCGTGSELDYESLTFGEYGLSMTGGDLVMGATCMFDVTIPIPVGTASGTYPNDTSDVTATVAAMTVTGVGASDDLEVITGPTLDKEFTDDPIKPGDSVTLEFTLTNDNPTMPPATTDFTATGIGFTDDLTFVAGLTATSLPPAGAACDPDGGGPAPATGTLSSSAGNTLLTFSGGTLAPGESCTFSATLASSASTPQGIHTNTTSDVTATVAGITTLELPTTDDLTVVDLAFTKSFCVTAPCPAEPFDDPVFPGGTVTLEFMIDNTSPTDGATSISFEDDLGETLTVPIPVPPFEAKLAPAATEIFPRPECGGTLLLSGDTLALSGGVLPAATTCTLTVELDVPAAASAGTYPNTTEDFAASIAGSPVIALPNATDDLVVDEAALTITKSFTDDPVEPGDTVTLKINVSNPTVSAPATDLAFTDDLEATLTGLLATGVFPVTDACVPVGGGTGTGTLAITGTQTLDYSGGTLAAGAACEITLTLTVPAGASAGNYPNTTSTLTGTIGGLPVVATAATDVLKVLEPAPSSADLSVSKVDLSDPVKAGETLTYTITVDNAGISDAANVIVTDVLPAGVTYVSDTGGCVEAPPGTLTCSLGVVPIVPGSTSFDVTVTVDSDTPAGTITNDVSVTSNTSDPDGTNNTVSTDTTVVVEADLAISKTDSPDPVLAGEELVYTITVNNLGPSDATSVTVTDLLPAEVTYVSDTGGCVQAPAGTLTCSLGTIVPTGSTNFDVTVDVDSGTTATSIANVASVASPVPDPVAGNDSAIALTTVETEADLVITKVDIHDPVIPGTQQVYTIEVTNAGPSDATGVTVVDTVPAGLMYLFDTDACSPGVPAPGFVTCDLGTIPAGGTGSFDIVFTVDPAATGTITNEVVVSSDVTDPATKNNTATEDTDLAPEADLVISKVDLSDPAVAGTAVTYTITVENFGPSDATGVTVLDDVPAGLMFDTATVPCTPSVPGPGLLTCDLGTIPAGSPAAFDVTFTIDPSLPPGTITNEATVSADSFDPDTTDNTTTEDTVVLTEADLSITKTDLPDPVIAGETLTYSITVANAGPSDAADVIVTDLLPAGTTLDATSGCAEDPGGVPTCTLGTIAAGDSADYTITVGVDPFARGTVLNEAHVAELVGPNEVPPVATMGFGRALVVADPFSGEVCFDLSLDALTGTVTGAHVHAAPTGSNGPIVVNLDWPTNGLGGCVPVDSATIDAINAAPGDHYVNVHTTAHPGGEIRGQLGSGTAAGAVVDTSTFDPDPTNNGATAETEILAVADLAIDKVDTTDPAVAGTAVTYTIDVTNSGPSGAIGVTVVDDVPAGLMFDSATVPCTPGVPGPGQLTCDLGTIATGDTSGPFDVTFTIDPALAAGPITNSATVSSDATDPDTSDNTATEDTEIIAVADLAIFKVGDPTAVAGTSTTYTMEVVNLGPSDATGVTVVDDVPAGLMFDTATVPCTPGVPGPGQLTCDLGTIATGDTSGTFDVTFTIDPALAAGPITNSATVSSDATDPDTSDNTATEDTEIIAVADLAIFKVGDPTAVAGTSTTYTMEVVNLGPSDATGVTVVDDVPAGLMFDTATVPCTPGVPGPGQLTCDLGTIATGDTSGTFDVTFTIDPALAAGPITNSATVSSDATDPDTSDNTATEDTDIVAEADLTVTKVDTEDPVLAGESVTYEIVVENFGPSDATNVTVVDTVPTGLMFDSATVACAPTVPGVLECDLGTIAAGDTSGPFDVTFTIDPAAPAGDITNTATVSSDIFDPDTSDNTATEDTTVETEADLVISKTDTTDPVLAGTVMTYSFDVFNDGPSDALDVTVTDTVPAGLMYDTSTVPCAPIAPGVLECDLGDLPTGFGGSFEIDFFIDPAAPADTVTNSATIESATTDPDTTNNNATEDTTINSEADLEITKSDAPDPVVAGEDLTYTITVDNLGPSDAADVVVTDLAPPGTSFVSTDGCAEDPAGAPTCTLGSIAAGGSASYTLTVAVDPGATGFVVNDALVAVLDGANEVPAGSGDPTGSGLATLVADPLAGEICFLLDSLVVQSTVVAAHIHEGAAGVNGPVFVDLDWPANGPSGCVPADATVIAAINAAPGDFYVNVHTDQHPAGAVRGQLAAAPGASVASPTLDPDLSNNAATEDTEIVTEADLAISKADEADPVLAGTDVTYTITVDNIGPSDATAVTVVDTLPAGVTYVSDTDSCVEAPVGTLTCDLGTIPASDSATFDVTVTVAPGTTGTITNTATVSSATPDPDTTDNTVTEDTTIGVEADIAITKSADVTSAVPGEDDITYTIVVLNTGPASEPAVAVADTFPSALDCTYTSTATGGATGNTASGSGNLADTLSMPPDSSATYVATCTIDPAATGTVTNTATAAGSAVDLVATNDSASVGVELTPEVDIAVSIESGAALVAGQSTLADALGAATLSAAGAATGSATPGASVAYTIVVSNLGPSADPAVKLTDSFPAVLTCAWTSTAASGASGNTASGSGNISETLSMPSGSSVTYSVNCTIDPDATGTLTNTVTAIASVTDRNALNNAATSSVTLAPTADISVTKDNGVTTAISGVDRLTYRIQVSNAGPSTDPKVALVDNFPAVLTCTWTSQAIGGASGNTTSGSASIGDSLSMPPGSSATYVVSCSIDRNARGTLSNTATATASVTDPNPSNNNATDTDTLKVPTDTLPGTGSSGSATTTAFALATLFVGLLLLGFVRLARRRRLLRTPA